MTVLRNFFLLALITTAFSTPAAAWQRWMWVGGPNTVNQSGVYGTKGEPNAANIPGGRLASSSWTDNAGNLFIFGGVGRDSAGSIGYLNDIWKYELDTGFWTWVAGSNTINPIGSYGTKGEPNSTNVPGGRHGSVCWKDGVGNVWIFGGLGCDSSGFQGRLNDLWKYEPTSGLWVWMSGSDTRDQLGVYGTKGEPNSSNVPGARYGGVGWADKYGNFYLFGGEGYDSTHIAFDKLNDLWKYEPQSGLWTWISGSDLYDQGGVYGIKGEPNAANVPGARYFSAAWTDDSGALWLFGGYGSDKNGSGGWLNDLWEFDIALTQWTWRSGSSTRGQSGVYGIKGEPNSTDVPGGRCGSDCWEDNRGNLWLFGGLGYDYNDTTGYLNDSWKFETSSGLWVWMSGSDTKNQYGIYGTKGEPNSANVPGGRDASTSWIDNNGNLWLFGGYGYGYSGSFGYLSDLWKFELYCDRPTGDLNGDCIVDNRDLAILCGHWLQDTTD